MLSKMGDRGGNIAAIQDLLNRAASERPFLKTDGIFGTLTRARVLEFQRDEGLKADGIVGDATTAALKKERLTDLQFLVQLSQLAAQGAQGLTGQGAGFFDVKQRALRAPLVAQRQDKSPAVASIGLLTLPFQIAFRLTPAGQAFTLIILLMTLIIALMLNSKNPALRQRGRHWEREVENMQNTAGEKGAGEAARDAAAKSKQQAKEYVDSKADSIKKCKDGNLNAVGPCGKALAEIERVLAELAQKFRQSFDSFPSIAAGIARNMQELFAALRDAAVNCKGCDDLV